jgi:hypothetical protein
MLYCNWHINQTLLEKPNRDSHSGAAEDASLLRRYAHLTHRDPIRCGS